MSQAFTTGASASSSSSTAATAALAGNGGDADGGLPKARVPDAEVERVVWQYFQRKNYKVRCSVRSSCWLLISFHLHPTLITLFIPLHPLYPPLTPPTPPTPPTPIQHALEGFARDAKALPYVNVNEKTEDQPETFIKNELAAIVQ